MKMQRIIGNVTSQWIYFAAPIIGALLATIAYRIKIFGTMELMTACLPLYTVCREIGISRTIKDIAAISNIRRKELARIYRLLVFELDIKIPMVDPMKCICKVSNKAKKILDWLNLNKLL